jgi:hypothetical protein
MTTASYFKYGTVARERILLRTAAQTSLGYRYSVLYRYQRQFPKTFLSGTEKCEPILLCRGGELRLGVQNGVNDGRELGRGWQRQAVHHHHAQERHHVPLSRVIRQ